MKAFLSQYNEWIIRHHPTAWLLRLHVILPLWTLGIGLLLLLLELGPIAESVAIDAVLSGIAILYLATFITIFTHMTLVTRSIRLFAEVVRRPLVAVVMALLSCVLLASSPMLVYQRFHARMVEEFRWTQDEVCQDVAATTQVRLKCELAFGVGYLDGPPRTRDMFERCTKSAAQLPYDAALARVLDACGRHGYTCADPVCSGGRGGGNGGGDLSRFYDRLSEVHELAVRGPWIFRLFDYLLFVAATVGGALVYTALRVRFHIWRRVTRILVGAVVVVLFLDQVIGNTNTEILSTGVVMTFVVCVALTYAVLFTRAAATLSATVSAMALTMVPVTATLLAWLCCPWYGPSHTSRIVDVFLSLREHIGFDVEVLARRELHPSAPGAWEHYANLYLPYILGVWCLLFFLLTMCLIEPGSRRASAEPDN